ncbi:MAG: metallophosphoesterase [Deltaproteobacteria bacterium]|nr:metallophosphoesterase [Deltaproteobacteria bacterium]
MMFGLPFATFRLTILTLALLAQIYLFLLARRAILSSRRSDRFKSRAVGAAGAAISLLFAANLDILFRPIPWADPPAAAQIILFYPPVVWNLGSLFSALLLFLGQIAGFLARRIVHLARRLAGRSAPPVDPGRRLLLQAGAGGLFAVPLLLAGYGASHAGRRDDIQELALPFGCPLRVVQLTDIHAGIFMNRRQMRYYVDQVISLQPDLFVLTGDYVSNSLSFLPGCMEEMARVRARYGTFATLGNHEHWYGSLIELRAIFRRYGVPLLNNEYRIIRTDTGRFSVIGIDDLRTGESNLEAALYGLDPAIPGLLLSHRPEIFPRATTLGIPLTLSGHYHGGQIKLGLPGGGISLAHLRTPYVEGLFRIGAARLYVSRGIGTTFTPVRLNAPPEITLLHLT